MLNRLRAMWDHRCRIRQLERCNAKLAERNEELEDERIRRLNQINDLRTQKSCIKQYAEKLEAERDKLKADRDDDANARGRRPERGLAAANARADRAIAEHNEAIAKHRRIQKDYLRHSKILQERADAFVDELAAKTKLLEETTASLIDAKRQHGKLKEEFDRLAGMFRKKLDDLAAAEQLLNEAGADIDTLRWTRNMAVDLLGERSVKLDRIAAIARR